MNFFTGNFRVLAKQATFLCGLSFGCLYSKPTYRGGEFPVENGWRDPDAYQELLFCSLATLGIGFSMLVMIVSAWCLIMGTDLAYRGDDGSMSRAINGMYEERKWVLRIFYCGLSCTISAVGSLAWAKLREYVSVYCVVVLFCFCVGTVLYVRFSVREHFKFPAENSRRPNEFLVGDYNPEFSRVASGAAVKGGSSGDVQLKVLK